MEGYEPYHYALSHVITPGAWVFLGFCTWTFRPFDGYITYTDIDCEYQSHHWTWFNVT